MVCAGPRVRPHRCATSLPLSATWQVQRCPRGCSRCLVAVLCIARLHSLTPAVGVRLLSITCDRLHECPVIRRLACNICYICSTCAGGFWHSDASMHNASHRSLQEPGLGWEAGLGWEPGLELLVRPAVLSALPYLRALGRALTACCRLRCSTCLDSSAGRCTGVPANRWHGQQVPRFTSAPAVLV